MRKLILLTSTYFVLLLLPIYLLGEGTKQLAPNPEDRVFLYCNVEEYGNFAQYGSTDVQRIYIHIEDPDNELVYLGFSEVVTRGHYPCEGEVVDGYFRIVNPNGTVVFPQRGVPTGQILDASTINITAKSQAMNGPNQVVGTGGYDAFVFNPAGLAPGDYYIEFSREEATPTLDEYTAIEWWDITVATRANPTAIDGRVYSKNWALFTPSITCNQDTTFGWFDRPFNGSFFVYTSEQMVAKTDFNNSGFQAAAFNVFFNDFGTNNTGDVVEDRKSLYKERTGQAQHRIFLNDPDINVYPSGKLGIYSLVPRFLACDNGASCVKASVTEPGQIDVLLDFDQASGSFTYDKGTADRILAFKVIPQPGESPPYIRCIPWDGLDGLGQRVASISEANKNMLVRYAQGIYHFPIYDAEFMLKGFVPETIRPIPDIGSPGRVYYDDRNIMAESGTGEINEETFNSCQAPCHQWINQPYGDRNTLNTWFFSREESQTQIIEEDCPIEAADDTAITVINLPTNVTMLDNDRGGTDINRKFLRLGNITPSNGMVTFDSIAGDLDYTPNFAFIGNDTFEYVMCLDILPVDALCDTALVIVEVQPADQEDCENAIDDDGDGLADCDDPDCTPITPKGIIRGN